MDKIDKTKEKLGLNSIDDKTKKQLFQKFVDAGGKVVTEKQKKTAITIDREKQRQLLKKFDKAKEKTASSPSKTASLAKTPAKKQITAQDVPQSGFFDLLLLRLKLFFMGVTKFDGFYFKNQFFEKFHNIYSPSLMDLQILYLDLFKRNLKAGDLVVQGLDKIRPIYFELIDSIGNLYDKILMDQIIEQYVKFSNVPKRTTELREPLVHIYRQLRIIYSYRNSLIEGFNLAVNIYVKVSEDKSFSSSSAKRRIRNSVDIIFSKLYPRLHFLFCNYIKTYLELEDVSVDKILNISGDELPGNRSRMRTKEKEISDQKQDEKENEEESISLPVRKGLALMSKLDMAVLRKEADAEHVFNRVSENDKVLATYVLFYEFDKQYSVILTTNKIKYNDTFGAHEVQHYKTRLQDLYAQMRKPFLSLRNYAEEYENVVKYKKEKSSDSNQYIEFTKQLETMEKKKFLASKDARMAVKLYMEKIASELNTLIEDMGNKQIYVSNPTEVIEFDSHIEGDKKINGKLVSEAISMAYCYASALAFRLESGGDLSGNIEFTEEEMEKMKPGEVPPAMAKEEESPEKDDKSVIDELQDMV